MITTLYLFLLTICASQTLTVINPEIPYQTWLGSGLTVGNKISITGRILPAAKHFAFNIRNHNWERNGSYGLVHLHFNPRFFEPDYYVVCNTHIKGRWTKEKRTLSPFKKGKKFRLQIFCEEDHFKIYVDGKSYVEYKYWLPLSSADALDINGIGEVEIYNINVNKGGTFAYSPGVLDCHPNLEASILLASAKIPSSSDISRKITSTSNTSNNEVENTVYSNNLYQTSSWATSAAVAPSRSVAKFLFLYYFFAKTYLYL